MIETTHMRKRVEHAFLLLLVVTATIAFAWLASSFVGAILWGVIATILFAPLHKRLLLAMPGRPNLAALITLLVIVAVVIVPATLLGGALVGEASAAYGRMQAGEIDLAKIFVEAERHLPQSARNWLADIGLVDFEAVRSRIGKAIAGSFQSMMGHVLTAGQSTFGFFLSLGVMLYLTFFLLRDGDALVPKIERCLPLPQCQANLLVARFVGVVNATIKGSLVVAIAQGLIGGLTFWGLGIGGALLWGVAMGVLSLFPAIGTGFIWVPMSIYLLLTGDVWQAAVLFACGFFIISSVDNILRPIMVGHDAQMPNYVVLIATLGGFKLMGFNGFVIGPVIAAMFIAVWEIIADPPATDLPLEVEDQAPEKTRQAD